MSLLDRRIRGFRLVDIWALGLLVVLILGVYLAKTIAGGERSEIATVERQIDLEKTRVRLLQAEVAHLEQPSRVEHLATAYLGLAAVKVDHEIDADHLGDVAAKQPVNVKVAAAPTAAPSATTTAPVVPPANSVPVSAQPAAPAQAAQ
jgi:cell division protein FtsL